MNKKHKIEVSVLIPNFNYGIYIEQCIKSILESDFDKDKLEIVIVDDASTDNSVEIIKKIKNTSPIDIKIIEKKKNSGLAKSRNEAIKNASGNYLFFLDSDNYVRKDCLKNHFEFLSGNKQYTACYAPIQRFDDITGNKVGLLSYIPFDFKKLSKGNYIDAMAMFVKKDLVEVGMYDENVPFGGWEDYELWLRLGVEHRKVHFIEGDPLSYYRVHADSMINSLGDSMLDENVNYIKAKYNVLGQATGESSNDLALTNKPDKIKIQIFWANETMVFTEENSQYYYLDRVSTSQRLDFVIQVSENNVHFLRFDLGDQAGAININSLLIKSDNGEVIWSLATGKVNLKKEIVFIRDNAPNSDRIIQLSLNDDPWFIIKLSDSPVFSDINSIIAELNLSELLEEQKQMLYGDMSPFSFSFQENGSYSEPSEIANGLHKKKIAQPTELQDPPLNNLIKDKEILSTELLTKTKVLDTLFSEKEQLVKTNEMLSIEMISLKNQNLDLSQSKVKLEGELHLQQEKYVVIKEAQQDISNKYQELESKNKELSMLNIQLESELKHKLDKYQELLEKAEKDILQAGQEKLTLISELSFKEEMINKIYNEKNVFFEKVTQMQSELDRLQSHFTDKEKELLKREYENNESKEAIKVLNTLTRELSEEKTQLENILKDETKQLQELVKLNENRNDEIANLNYTTNKMKATIERLTATVNEYQNRYDGKSIFQLIKHRLQNK